MTRFDVTFRDYTAPSGWKLSTALHRLDVSTEPFDHINNSGADGYSHARVLAINPEPLLWKVPIIAAHELAHIVLGHTAFVLAVEQLRATEPAAEVTLPLARFELEAHTVARAVTLGMGLDESELQTGLVRHYIDRLERQCEPLGDSDGIRLAWATISILEAGEAPVVADAPRAERVW